MIEDRDEAARLWWEGLDENARDKWVEKVGKTFEAGGKDLPSPERILRRLAYDVVHHDAASGASRNRVVKQ